MKKNDNWLTKEYSPIKLYLDDLENIEEVLKSSSDIVSIKTEDYEYDSIDELCNHVKAKTVRIKTLEFKTSNPYISIEFTKSRARVHVSSSDKNAGIFFKLDQIISSRTRNPKWLFSPYFILVSPPLISLIFVLVSIILSNSYFLIPLIAPSLIFLPVFIWSLYVDLKKHSVISLMYKKSWLAESVDKQPITFLQIIVTVVIAVITLLGGWLLRGYFN